MNILTTFSKGFSSLFSLYTATLYNLTSIHSHTLSQTTFWKNFLFLSKLFFFIHNSHTPCVHYFKSPFMLQVECNKQNCGKRGERRSKTDNNYFDKLLL